MFYYMYFELNVNIRKRTDSILLLTTFQFFATNEFNLNWQNI